MEAPLPSSVRTQDATQHHLMLNEGISGRWKDVNGGVKGRRSPRLQATNWQIRLQNSTITYHSSIAGLAHAFNLGHLVESFRLHAQVAAFGSRCPAVRIQTFLFAQSCSGAYRIGLINSELVLEARRMHDVFPLARYIVECEGLRVGCSHFLAGLIDQTLRSPSISGREMKRL